MSTKERRRWRYENDPEYRARINRLSAESHRRRRKGLPSSPRCRIYLANGQRCQRRGPGGYCWAHRGIDGEAPAVVPSGR